jgi:hypothetical protein
VGSEWEEGDGDAEDATGSASWGTAAAATAGGLTSTAAAGEEDTTSFTDAAAGMTSGADATAMESGAEAAPLAGPVALSGAGALSTAFEETGGSKSWATAPFSAPEDDGTRPEPTDSSAGAEISGKRSGRTFSATTALRDSRTNDAGCAELGDAMLGRGSGRAIVRPDTVEGTDEREGDVTIGSDTEGGADNPDSALGVAFRFTTVGRIRSSTTV